MTTIHIAGCMCSGKSTLIKQIVQSQSYLISTWDVKEDFYIPNDIIKNGVMNWELYKEKKSLIRKAIADFLVQSRKTIRIIESSGVNQTINLALNDYTLGPKTIWLLEPSVPRLERCVKERGGDIESALKFRKQWIAHVDVPQSRHTYEEAFEILDILIKGH